MLFFGFWLFLYLLLIGWLERVQSGTEVLIKQLFFSVFKTANKRQNTQ